MDFIRIQYWTIPGQNVKVMPTTQKNFGQNNEKEFGIIMAKEVTQEQIEMIEEMVARAQKAAAIIETYDQARVDRLAQAVAAALYDLKVWAPLCDEAVDETHLGDKVSKRNKRNKLKLILREETPTEGRVLVNGQDVARLRRRKIPYLRRQMGIIFQDFRLIPSMTVYENVAFAMHVLNVPHKEIRPRVEYILELVHLEDKAKCYPDTLSGGEQQRVAVARALVHNPKLVIADEPTGNIDPELSLEMMQLLERVSKMGITVLVVTHEHELVHRFHQRVVTLSHGRIVSDVPADPVAAAEDDLSLDVAAFDADDAAAAKKEVAAV